MISRRVAEKRRVRAGLVRKIKSIIQRKVARTQSLKVRK